MIIVKLVSFESTIIQYDLLKKFVGEGNTVEEAIIEWNKTDEAMKQSYAEDNPRTTARIQQGLHSFARDLSQVSLV